MDFRDAERKQSLGARNHDPQAMRLPYNRTHLGEAPRWTREARALPLQLVTAPLSLITFLAATAAP